MSLLALVPSSLPAAICHSQFGARIDLGIVTHASVVEASGLAASRRNSSVYYTHNDSGDASKVYAINEQGRHLCTFTVNGWGARDWEDIAVGPGPQAGQFYMYVGEIGDNSARYATKYILRIPEPFVSSSQASTLSTLSSYDVIAFRLPDGVRDAEALMVDPLTLDIFIVSKVESSPAEIYRLPYPQSTTGVITAQLVGNLDMTLITGGSISPSGCEILVKNYGKIYHWCRYPGETVAQAMIDAPTVVPYIPESQGEGICWKAHGGGYVTIGEQTLPHLYYYRGVASASSHYVKHDYSGDHQVEPAVYWRSARRWYVTNPQSAPALTLEWGGQNDLPVPGDYNGDGAADLATYNPENGVWSLRISANDGAYVQFGWDETVPVPADYDGDRVTDAAVYHPASGTWFIQKTTGGAEAKQFGWSESLPIPADYDGDGKDDVAVYHPATGNWYIDRSTAGLIIKQFGWSAALPIPADYDGDGKADIAVYHPAAGNWYIQQSTAGLKIKQFGWSASMPVPADYDGDGKDDIAVYHQAAGNWYLLQSAVGLKVQNFGWSAAEPVVSDPAIWINH